MSATTTAAAGAAPIRRILSMARRAFARGRDESRPGRRVRLLRDKEFAEALEELKRMLAGLRAEDLGLNLSPALCRNKAKNGIVVSGGGGGAADAAGQPPVCPADTAACQPPATRGRNNPITYIGVYEDSDVSVGIFILQNGFRIPLHNHPRMHGFLKVVSGRLCIDRFDVTPLPPPEELPESLRVRPGLLTSGRLIPATSSGRVVLGAADPPALLAPDRDNFHEIVNNCGEPAAFLDILAPPYNLIEEDQRQAEAASEALMSNGACVDVVMDHLVVNGGGDRERRECDFFKVVRFQSKVDNDHDDDNDDDVNGGCKENFRHNKVFWLQRSYNDYHCDSEPYLGPPVI